RFGGCRRHRYAWPDQRRCRGCPDHWGNAQPRGEQDHHSSFFVLADSPIKTAQDLKGKSIAVNTLGAQLEYVVRLYLKQNGMSLSDVQLVAVPGPQLEQVLRHKQVDVAAVGAW